MIRPPAGKTGCRPSSLRLYYTACYRPCQEETAPGSKVFEPAGHQERDRRPAADRDGTRSSRPGADQERRRPIFQRPPAAGDRNQDRPQALHQETGRRSSRPAPGRRASAPAAVRRSSGSSAGSTCAGPRPSAGPDQRPGGAGRLPGHAAQDGSRSAPDGISTPARSSDPGSRPGAATRTGHACISARTETGSAGSIPGRDTRSRSAPRTRSRLHQREPAEISRTQDGRRPSAGQDPARHPPRPRTFSGPPPRTPPAVCIRARSRPASAASARTGSRSPAAGTALRSRSETETSGPRDRISGKRTGKRGKRAGNGPPGRSGRDRETSGPSISGRDRAGRPSGRPGWGRERSAGRQRGRSAGPPPAASGRLWTFAAAR